MKCCDVEFGSFSCAKFIELPWQLEDGGRKTVAIDRCLLPEVISLWEQGIRTTGCCCGHGNSELSYIGVEFEDIDKMKSLGYKVRFNPMRPTDEDSFIPKTFVLFR